jgi:hypothetical protein
LHPLAVVNPYARHLTFLDDKTRTRRDHTKYLTLIRALALLHQYQRKAVPLPNAPDGAKTSYIEVTLDDIAAANRLAHEVLGRSLDELPPQTRRLLLLIEQMVAGECQRRKMDKADFRFSRRDLRAFIGWGDTQLKIHLQRLVEMEYALVHRGGRGQSFVYELLYDGQGKDGRLFLPGLIDVDKLRAALPPSALESTQSGAKGSQSGSSRPAVGQVSGGATPLQNGVPACKDAALPAIPPPMAENAVPRTDAPAFNPSTSLAAEAASLTQESHHA